MTCKSLSRLTTPLHVGSRFLAMASSPPAKVIRTEEACALPVSSLPMRSLGTSSLIVSQMGYGAWPLSYDNRPPEADAINVLRVALDRAFGSSTQQTAIVARLVVLTIPYITQSANK